MGPTARLLLLVHLLLLYMGGPRPAAAAGLTMAEAVSIALKQNPQVAFAVYNYKAADAFVGIQRSPWLPQLTSTTSVTGSYSYQTGLPNTGSPLQTCDPNAPPWNALPGSCSPGKSLTANPAALVAYTDVLGNPCNPMDPNIVPGSCNARTPTLNNFNAQRYVNATAPAPDTSTGQYRSLLSLSQTIFDFGRTYYNITEAKALARAAIGDLNTAKQTVALGAITGFLGVLQQEALQRVAVATLAQQEQRLQQIQGFFSIGTKAKIDLLTQKTAVAQARLALVQANSAVRLARITFQQALGGGDAAFQPLEEPEDKPLPEESQPADRVVQRIVESRPEVVGNRERYISTIENAKGLRGGYLPILSLTGTLSLSGLTGNSNAALAGGILTVSGNPAPWSPLVALSGSVNLTWPLFSGLSTLYTVRQAWAQADQARATLDLSRQAVRASTEQALLQVTQSREALTAAEVVLVQAEEQLALANGRYKAGVGSIIEVGDAQLTATTSRVQRVQAVYTLLSARGALLLQLGQLINGVPQL